MLVRVVRPLQWMSLAAVVAAALVPAAVAAGKPSVAFVSPSAGATTSSTVRFTVRLANFELDPEDVGKRNRSHRGHLHFQMDGGKFDFPKYSGANGVLAAKLGIAGKYSPSVTPSITYRHLPP